jgi:hypothetical protein
MSDLTDKTRPELEDIARDAGVPDPEDLPNKQALAQAIEGPNPALAPDPPPPRGEQTYRVVGPREVLGRTRGDTFKVTLTAEHEASLVEAGHIIRVDDDEHRSESNTSPSPS